jgi:hypothetical protein
MACALRKPTMKISRAVCAIDGSIIWVVSR